ncbi:MAG: tagaturonate epimerase family protein, partial [Terriglobia bacterium]
MTTSMSSYMNTSDTAPPLPLAEAQSLAIEIGRLSGLEIYPRSITAIQHSLFFLGQRDGKKFLGVLSANSVLSNRFTGQKKPVTLEGKPFTLTIAETSASTASALRAIVSFLAARPLGLQKSVGCGDRLGLATPGHVRAVRGSGIAPIFAQQSMRENARTGRTPQEVMDDAMWGVFQEGWREGFGA